MHSKACSIRGGTTGNGNTYSTCEAAYPTFGLFHTVSLPQYSVLVQFSCPKGHQIQNFPSWWVRCSLPVPKNLSPTVGPSRLTLSIPTITHFISPRPTFSQNRKIIPEITRKESGYQNIINNPIRCEGSLGEYQRLICEKVVFEV